MDSSRRGCRLKRAKVWISHKKLPSCVAHPLSEGSCPVHSTHYSMDTKDFSAAFIDTLGIDDFTKAREFGRERGLNPVLSEMSKKNLEELVQRLNYSAQVKAKKTTAAEDDEDVAVTFDIKSEPRCVLNKGYISTKSYNSLVPHNQRRYAYLLNDVLLITSPPSAGYSIFTEKLNIYHVIYLDSVSFIDLRNVNPSEDPCAFALRTSERPFHILAESESDKKIWLEELELAIFAIFAGQPNLSLGWNHEILLGTIYSAAVLGEVDLLNKHIQRLVGASLDTPDGAGMTALHWACLMGHAEAVMVLLDAGADIDCLNSGLNSALMLAVACGHETVALLLLNRNADVFIRNMKGVDCLTMSVLYGSGSGLSLVVMALQGQGVDLNKMDSSGATPLHECAARSLADPIQVLVDAGADVNIKHYRNGLTPLQMACCAAEPDPITVDSFLKKGAHPNWRDTAKRTSFDMVLATQTNVRTRISNKGQTKEAISQLSPFVQTALTTLLFLVRKGARFTEESIQHLKPSFQETLKAERAAWEKLSEHPHFVHYIEANKSGLRQAVDMPDNASEHCLLCLDKFTMANRRHHCRGCGVLVCVLCSTKRLCFTNPFAAGKSPASVKPDRVCDGCFNRYMHECSSWLQNEIEKSKQQIQDSFSKAEDELEANKTKARAIKKPSTLSTFYRNTAPSSFSLGSIASDPGANGRLVGSFDDGKSSSVGAPVSPIKAQSFSVNPSNGTPPPPNKAASFSVRPVTRVDENSAQLQGTLDDTRRALDERGQKLGDLADKTDAMNTAASDFLTNARKLNEQQRRSKWHS